MLTPDTVRDTNWSACAWLASADPRFTIFNFRPSAVQYMSNLEAGTQLMVEGESP